MLDKLKNLLFQEDDKKDNKFNIFLGLVDSYLKREHPKIKFDLSIIDEILKEENFKIRKTLFIDEVVRQFIDFEYLKKTQESVKKELLWNGYGINSIPNLKKPQDFLRRKEVAFFRDKGTCDRCGNKMDKLSDAHTLLILEAENGGGYNLENIAILCFDCHKILTNESRNIFEIPLKIRDELYNFV
ncbi:HNH endonuclease [Aliarcobacter lanthieri]|uniref:HNH endonuclease n=1 Tax=Arcobacteraceae TaxID=2808963 RepID=UPI000DEA0A22|nr:MULTISPECIES: HNH endonuclease [Arcobacteraceae]MBL3519308.1 HNH endonuclease [Aliarcobacter lanthieri]RBQ26185.1 HNH endonuclease [Arcobacter sp. CECT 9188]